MPTPSSKSYAPAVNSPPSNLKPMRRRLQLAEAEFQKRRAKVLCFSCDEKYNLGHVCTKLLQLMFVCDDDSATAEDGIDMGDVLESLDAIEYGHGVNRSGDDEASRHAWF
ncbi:hypothetical protein Scep_009413 [Stephania cephalantha]|uniref:Uncharacterized protein n=1 Tax=Stephania cephalantha TaxID=152367 RepID=A0AAP0PD56_9MAGN